MIRNLHIVNYALIDELDMNLQSGFSVITGETGAGKSIILGAIGLLLGQRVNSASQRNGEKTVVEAVFDVGQYNLDKFFSDNDFDFDGCECVIRREITTAGKSRAFINDSPASLTQVKELGDKLMDIHSQHQNLLLNKENFQIDVLDIMANNSDVMLRFQTAFKHYKTTCSKLESAIETAKKAGEEEDYLRFQVNQFQGVKLRKDEQEELEQEAEMLSHAEEIKEKLFTSLQLLNSDNGADVLNNIHESMRMLHHICDVFPKAEELAERLDSCYIELKDIATEIESQSECVEYNPNRLEIVNERLSQIYALQQKYHVNTITELLSIQSDMEGKLLLIDNSSEEIDRLRLEALNAKVEAERVASQLSKLRSEAAKKMKQEMTDRLISLGMPNVQFEIDMSEKDEMDVYGKDKVAFKFSANKNMPLQNISQVASGGEIARVMLSLKAMIAGAVQMPTIIFDEIDTGVSGGIAEKMARIMREMGDNGRQVIAITHLPQIAAMGEYHFKVYKDESEERTTTHIAELDEANRIDELAHMLSGEAITQASLDNARALRASSGGER
ncbi:MAG: DNA repair protein RecN [Bacteroidaceae bacterium]|nr:DNA repair protein RecN [Bacteroidaceae bacterium]